MQLGFGVNPANLTIGLHCQQIDGSQQLGTQKRNVILQTLVRTLTEIKPLATVHQQLPQWRAVIGKRSKKIKVKLILCLKAVSTTMLLGFMLGRPKLLL